MIPLTRNVVVAAETSLGQVRVRGRIFLYVTCHILSMVVSLDANGSTEIGKIPCRCEGPLTLQRFQQDPWIMTDSSRDKAPKLIDSDIQQVLRAGEIVP